MSKKTYEKSSTPVYQYSVTGLIDVYIGKEYLLSCQEKDLKTQQVQTLIKKKQNGEKK